MFDIKYMYSVPLGTTDEKGRCSHYLEVKQQTDGKGKAVARKEEGSRARVTRSADGKIDWEDKTLQKRLW